MHKGSKERKKTRNHGNWLRMNGICRDKPWRRGLNFDLEKKNLELYQVKFALVQTERKAGGNHIERVNKSV